MTRQRTYEPQRLEIIAAKWRLRMRDATGVTRLAVNQFLSDLEEISRNEARRLDEIRELCEADITVGKCGMKVCQYSTAAVKRKLAAIRKRTE